MASCDMTLCINEECTDREDCLRQQLMNRDYSGYVVTDTTSIADCYDYVEGVGCRNFFSVSWGL
jgi:hypothetical protein